MPGAVEPMLPRALSDEACSLVPGADRRVVTAELEFDGPRVVRTAFYRALIRSDERLDYERVDRIFAGDGAGAGPVGRGRSRRRGRRRGPWPASASGGGRWPSSAGSRSSRSTARAT